ncbi:MAG: hypothetical protein H2076_02630 [Planctomycetes bacterium]|nr:hypothetical protein [Planctomycetota bacterium]
MKSFKFLLPFAFALLLSVPALGQSYQMSISSGSGAPGASLDLQVSLDNNGDDIQGWSYGVCHDGSALSLTAVVDGSTTEVVKNGSPPDFNQVNVDAAEGFTVGVVICFTGCANLAAGTTGAELNVASYDLIGAPGTSTNVDFCNTLGSPTVETIVVVGGASITPDTTGGTVELVAGPPPFAYGAGDYDVDYDGNSGEVSFTASPSITENPDNPGFPSSTQGFSMGLQHDDSLLTIDSVDWNSDLGFDPDFAGVNLLANGWTIGVVYSFTGANTLAFETETAVLSAGYSSVASALAGLLDPTDTALTWTDSLGSPPVANVVVVGGGSIEAELTNGSVSLFPQYAPPDVPFIRGNCNGDDTVDIADGIWILNDLFQGGPTGTCLVACDANDDSLMDAADAIFVISYRLLSGPAPSAPWPDCGTIEGAECEATSYCP